jgi:hypothetical protein
MFLMFAVAVMVVVGGVGFGQGESINDFEGDSDFEEVSGMDDFFAADNFVEDVASDSDFEEISFEDMLKAELNTPLKVTSSRACAELAPAGKMGVCMNYLSDECDEYIPDIASGEENPCKNEGGFCCFVDSKKLCNTACKQAGYLGGQCMPFSKGYMVGRGLFDSNYVEVQPIGYRFCSGLDTGVSFVSSRQECYCGGVGFGGIGSQRAFVIKNYGKCYQIGDKRTVEFSFTWGGLEAHTAYVSIGGVRPQTFYRTQIGDDWKYLGDVNTETYQVVAPGRGDVTVTVVINSGCSGSHCSGYSLYGYGGFRKEFVISCQGAEAGIGGTEADYDATLEEFGGITQQEFLEKAGEGGVEDDPIEAIYCTKHETLTVLGDYVIGYITRYITKNVIAYITKNTYDSEKIKNAIKKLSGLSLDEFDKEIKQFKYDGNPVFIDVKGQMRTLSEEGRTTGSCIIKLREKKQIYGVQVSTGGQRGNGFLLGPFSTGNSYIEETSEKTAAEVGTYGTTIVSEFNVVEDDVIWVDLALWDGHWGVWMPTSLLLSSP